MHSLEGAEGSLTSWHWDTSYFRVNKRNRPQLLSGGSGVQCSTEAVQLRTTATYCSRSDASQRRQLRRRTTESVRVEKTLRIIKPNIHVQVLGPQRGLNTLISSIPLRPFPSSTLKIWDDLETLHFQLTQFPLEGTVVSSSFRAAQFFSSTRSSSVSSIYYKAALPCWMSAGTWQ